MRFRLIVQYELKTDDPQAERILLLGPIGVLDVLGVQESQQSRRLAWDVIFNIKDCVEEFPQENCCKRRAIIP